MLEPSHRSPWFLVGSGVIGAGTALLIVGLLHAGHGRDLLAVFLLGALLLVLGTAALYRWMLLTPHRDDHD